MFKNSLSNVKISLNCKLDSSSAYNFIKPISDLETVSHISVFRDNKAMACDKVHYYTTYKNRSGFWGQITKLFKMIKVIKRDYKLCIGIYEIPHGMLAFLLGKLKRIPVVISIIGNPAYTKVRRGLRKKVTYFMLKRCHAVTVTGVNSKQYLSEEGIEDKRIKVLPNSIDLNRFKILKNIEKEYDVICVSRLSQEKKLDNFIKVIQLIKKKHPNIKAAIAGKGLEKDNLKVLIENMNLKTNISLLGYIHDVEKLYNKGKVFLLTSQTEGLPRAVLESMACGVPCVASNVGDMEDIIKNNENGYLINNYKDINEYAIKIISLLENKELYEKYKKNAILNVGNLFSYKEAAYTWNKIINELR